ncbi:MAG: membrane protein [Cyclobacteriaceae bacterium]|nr:MAG: membrane protein [Cyclobacteriaceae bacterium]
MIGCVDLEEDPTIALLSPGEYNDLTEMELAVTGMYRKFGMVLTTFYVAGWAGDDMTTHRASNKHDFREFDQRFVSNSNSRAAGVWQTAYSGIRSANNVIFNSQNLQVTDQVGKDRLLGEAYFWRGLMYHHLTRVFGKLPLQLDPVPDTEIGLSEIQVVYGQIEADLLEAERLLPAIYPGVMPGAPRPNSGTARAFLARLYLDWAGWPLKDASKYDMAAASAKQVIDNHTSHGFDLMDNLKDLWTIEHRFNQESIFTLAFCADICGIINRKTVRVGFPADLNGWSETFAEIKFFEDFPPGPRKEATYITDPTIQDPTDSDFDPNGPTISWTAFTDQQQPIFAKITGFGDVERTNSRNNRNDYLMRYAELLLIYAEASGRSGNPNSDAWEALNKIKRRAAGLPFDTPDASVDVTSGDLAELAYTERKWELAGEYLRWFDLTRMERVAEALNNDYRNSSTSLGTNPDNVENFGKPIIEPNQITGSTGTDNYFAPIPLSEIEINPNLAN